MNRYISWDLLYNNDKCFTFYQTRPKTSLAKMHNSCLKVLEIIPTQITILTTVFWSKSQLQWIYLEQSIFQNNEHRLSDTKCDAIVCSFLKKKNPVSFACFSHYIEGSYYNFNKINLYRNKAAYQAMPLIEEHTIPRSYTNSFSIQLSCLLFALSFYANLETVPLFLWRSHDKYVRWGLLGRKL